MKMKFDRNETAEEIFEKIKKSMPINGDLDLVDSQVTLLPDGLEVDGTIDLRGTSISVLPKRLKVSCSLDIRGTSITELPDDLTVDGKILGLDANIFAKEVARSNMPTTFIVK